MSDCPSCGASNCYNSGFSIECVNPNCRFYSEVQSKAVVEEAYQRGRALETDQTLPPPGWPQGQVSLECEPAKDQTWEQAVQYRIDKNQKNHYAVATLHGREVWRGPNRKSLHEATLDIGPHRNRTSVAGPLDTEEEVSQRMLKQTISERLTTPVSAKFCPEDFGPKPLLPSPRLYTENDDLSEAQVGDLMINIRENAVYVCLSAVADHWVPVEAPASHLRNTIKELTLQEIKTGKEWNVYSDAFFGECSLLERPKPAKTPPRTHPYRLESGRKFEIKNKSLRHALEISGYKMWDGGLVHEFGGSVAPYQSYSIDTKNLIGFERIHINFRPLSGQAGVYVKDWSTGDLTAHTLRPSDLLVFEYLPQQQDTNS